MYMYLHIYMYMYKNHVYSAKRKKVQTLDSCFGLFGPHQQGAAQSLPGTAVHVHVHVHVYTYVHICTILLTCHAEGKCLTIIAGHQKFISELALGGRVKPNLYVHVHVRTCMCAGVPTAAEEKKRGKKEEIK